MGGSTPRPANSDFQGAAQAGRNPDPILLKTVSPESSEAAGPVIGSDG